MIAQGSPVAATRTEENGDVRPTREESVAPGPGRVNRIRGRRQGAFLSQAGWCEGRLGPITTVDQSGGPPVACGASPPGRWASGRQTCHESGHPRRQVSTMSEPTAVQHDPYPVLLMCRELGPGGSERQLTEMARALDRSSFTPHVGCFRAGGARYDELVRAGVPVAVFDVASFRRIWTLRGVRGFRSYVKRHRILLVHSFDVPLNVFTVPLGRLFGVPVVLSSQRAHRYLSPGLGRLLLRLTDRLAHGIVVNSLAMQQHLVQDERARPSKVHVCHNGVDLARFNPTGRPGLPQSGGSPVVIGTVCVLRPEKDLSTLLLAFANLHALEPETRLVVLGSGSEAARLEQQAVALGVGDACRFQPATSDVVPWLRSMDIFVLPSRSEAFSNALMEAMACGCCAIASNVGGNPELVKSGVTGLLFEAGDPAALTAALIELVRNPGTRSRLAEQGQQFVANTFSLPVAVRTLAEIYLGHLQEAGR